MPDTERRMSPDIKIRPLLHPVHAILLGFPIALFASALIADISYFMTAQIQWSNFAAWLITGALLVGGPVLGWAVLTLITAWRRGLASQALFYLLLVSAMWILGLVNAFQHSRDGWSSVGLTGIILSALSAGLALMAGWIAYSAYDRRGTL